MRIYLTKIIHTVLAVPIFGVVLGAIMNWLGFYTFVNATTGATMLATTGAGFLAGTSGLGWAISWILYPLVVTLGAIVISLGALVLVGFGAYRIWRWLRLK